MLPDKAIDVIDAAGARQKIRPEDEREVIITSALIEAEVSRIAKVPTQTVSASDTSKLERLLPDLQAVVFGQDGAVNLVNDTEILNRSGLGDPDKPQGIYLFTGPTGVGKTELSKQLAKTLGIEFVKFDMSEFQEKHTVSRLIGAPPGYVGFGDGSAGSGELINAVDKTPRCVLLFDEIEKAHDDIFKIFLQVMDYGVLTSSAGKKVSFKDAIIIFTTNAGAADAEKNTIGFNPPTDNGVADKALERLFSPEFRGRLDAIVKFNKLSRENMLQIVGKFTKELVERAAAKNVTLTFTDAALQLLAEKGYSTKYGARPLKGVINAEIAKPLSKVMLFGELKNGGTAVVLTNGADELVFQHQAPVAVEVPEAEILV
jgi:ATP-dependent Clp protease ATP-binding subunit ClpA